MEDQDERIVRIVGEGDEDAVEKSHETVKKYLRYLKENMEVPCFVTGAEDFPWEEGYAFGHGDKKEYERLKKENPSYKDKFELLEFEDVEEDEEQIFARVKRLSDQKEFSVELDYLKATDKKSKNFQLLDDYSVWFVNY